MSGRPPSDRTATVGSDGGQSAMPAAFFAAASLAGEAVSIPALVGGSGPDPVGVSIAEQPTSSTLSRRTLTNDAPFDRLRARGDDPRQAQGARPTAHPRGSRTSFAALTGIGLALPVRGTPLRDRARPTGRVASVAAAPAVPDEVMAEHGPVPLLEQRADLELDLIGFRRRRPAEAVGQPVEVGVHGDAGHVEGVAEHDVRGLATHAGQRDQVAQPARHLAVEVLDQSRAELDQGVASWRGRSRLE